jgi:Ca-activated chloride channel family protein
VQVLVPAAGAALLSIPLIVLLYFLKVRRPEVRVASLMFWRPSIADRRANAPWQRLRWSLLLLLQLAAALALGLSLMRPGFAGAEGVGKTTVVLINGSASMRATDVAPTRFGAAQQHARDLAGQLGPGQEMAVVLLSEHAQLLASPTSDSAVLRAAIDRASASGGGADLSQGFSLANALLKGRPGGSIVLIGDGHAQLTNSPAKLDAPLTYVSIGASDANAAIETLSRGADGTVFIRAANNGRSGRDLTVEMRADGKLVDVLPMHLDGNAAGQLVWQGLPSGTQVLEARLQPDALALDNSAWLVTAIPTHHKVLMVTAQNGFLERALNLRQGLDLTVIKPADYKPGTSYDLYVFDSFVPKGALPTPSLVIAPPQGSGPVASGALIDPGGVLPADPREALLKDVVLKDVHVQAAAQVAVPSDWHAVITATAAPLLLIHDGEPRIAELTFELHHSDLPLRAAFPILIQNLVSYLLPGGFENQVFAPGAAVTLVPEPGATTLDVQSPDGHVTRLAPPLPIPPFTQTSQIGVYTVTQTLSDGPHTNRFLVEFQDPAQSQIAPGATPLVDAVSASAGQQSRGTLEIWPWIALLALALILAEWMVFLRA